MSVDVVVAVAILLLDEILIEKGMMLRRRVQLMEDALCSSAAGSKDLQSKHVVYPCFLDFFLKVPPSSSSAFGCWFCL